MKSKRNIEKYLSANPLAQELESNQSESIKSNFSQAVVIPAYCESFYFPKTWQSLKRAIVNSTRKTLVVVLVNNPQASSVNPDLLEDIADNQKLLKKLRERQFEGPGNCVLAWIDASSPAREIRQDHGVGGARKLGMDTVLHFLDWEADPLIFSLDADSLVKKNYLSATRNFFTANPKISGAALDFRHQPGNTPEEEQAIRLYEEFMHQYVAGLRHAQSPYAYHSIGSTIVCRAESYIKAGGMRPRPAGEDFYFLQALCKSGNPPAPILDFSESCVYPSARLSNRVPFGTGTRMKEFIEQIKTENNPAVFYHPEIFNLLNKTLEGVGNGSLEHSVEKWFDSLPMEAKDFLNLCEFRKNWGKIIKNTPKDSTKIKWAFHTWFDAFRILKFIHFCEKEPYNFHRVSE